MTPAMLHEEENVSLTLRCNGRNMKAGLGEVQGDWLKNLKNEAREGGEVGCHGR